MVTARPLTGRGGPADTGFVRKGAKVPTRITVEDHDDRPERMVSDPDHYFAEARERAEQEVMRQAAWLSPRHRRQR